MITDKELYALGFIPEEKVVEEKEGFSYQVFKQEKEDSFIEVTNEFDAS